MKTKSFDQVLEESSPAVKKAYKKELKKVTKTKPEVKKKAVNTRIKKLNTKQTEALYGKPPVFKVTKTTGLSRKQKPVYQCNNPYEHREFPCPICQEVPMSRFADKDFDFNKFPSVKTMTWKEEEKLWKEHAKKQKTTAFPYEIEGEPILNCTKWQAMAVVIVLLGVMVYATHGDFEALTKNLIH